MFYEIDLRMFKNVYKSSTKILQIGSCGKCQPHIIKNDIDNEKKLLLK
jgi:hypothetical protein